MNREDEDRMKLLVKQLEQKDYEIAKLNKKYDYLIEQSPLGIYKSSLDGKFLEMNNRLANMLGYDTSEEAIEAITNIGNDIYVDKTLRSFKATQLLDTTEFLEYDIDFIKKDSTIFTGRVIAKVIRDDAGNPKSFFGFIQDVSTRNKVSKELQDSQDLFYTTFNNALDSNFIISLSDFRYIEVNKTFLRNTQTVYEDVIGKTSKDFGYFIFDEDMKNFKELLLNDKSLRNHVISINIQNQRRWFSINAIKIIWQGEPCAYVSSREITEERQMTSDLKASENKFRSLVSNANLGIVILQDLKIKYANPTAYKMFGYNENEKIPVSGFEYMHPEDIEFVKEMYNKRLAGEFKEADYMIRMLRKDKSTIYVNIRVTNIDWDGYPALMVFTNDVSDNIKAKNDLRESEEKYKKIFQNIQDVYYELTLDGEILIVSPSVERIAGINSKYLIGKRITDYYENPSDRDKLINLLLTKGYADDYEVVLKDKNGRRFMCSLSTSLVFDEQKIPVKIVGVMRDITSRKESEMKLKESEEQLKDMIKQKDSFVNLIAHDLRSPISGFMELTKDLKANYSNLSLNEMKEAIAAMNRSSTQLHDMLDNLLQWSRSQAGGIKVKKEMFSINKLIMNTIELYSLKINNKRLNVINEVNEDILVYADKSMISTVVQNLINNAIKFTNDNGEICFSSKILDETLCLSIKDNGIGIDEEHINTLFNISGQYLQQGTRGEPGSGLGLLLCKEFVEKNNGQIYVESKKDNGTEFTICLPIKE